ncbi:MAG TPA: hypothetical protein ACHBX0_09750 [Arsenophonus sp.]
MIKPENILLANNTSTYTVTAKTINEHGQPIENENIMFEISGLKLPNSRSGVTLLSGDKTDDKKIMVSTNNQKEAVVKIRSKATGKGSLIATMENGNYLKKNIQFIADKSTATLSAAVQANSAIMRDDYLDEHPNSDEDDEFVNYIDLLNSSRINRF